MDYDEFLKNVRKMIEAKEEGIQVKITSVLKNNYNLQECLTILKCGENMGPAIYMKQYFRKYQSGESLEQISEQILRYHRMHWRAGCVDMSFFSDFDKVRDQIVCRLVNYRKNRELLDLVPHRQYLDLAVVYYYRMEDSVLGKGSILIQNDHVAVWDSDIGELDDLAVSNTVRLLPYDFMSISDMISELPGVLSEGVIQEIPPIYVLTNVERSFGAVNIIYDSILDAISTRLSGDYYILPSSVHECMIVPVADGLDRADLHQMVRDINEEFVLPEDLLGDSVYRYSSEKRKLLLDYPAGRDVMAL